MVLVQRRRLLLLRNIMRGFWLQRRPKGNKKNRKSWPQRANQEGKDKTQLEKEPRKGARERRRERTRDQARARGRERGRSKERESNRASEPASARRKNPQPVPPVPASLYPRTVVVKGQGTHHGGRMKNGLNRKKRMKHEDLIFCFSGSLAYSWMNKGRCHAWINTIFSLLES